MQMILMLSEFLMRADMAGYSTSLIAALVHLISLAESPIMNGYSSLDMFANLSSSCCQLAGR